MTDLQRAQQYFEADCFASKTVGITIEEVHDGYARVSLKNCPCLQNSWGAVMGGALYTMADYAFAIAANYDNPLTVTASAQISFFSPAKSEAIVAEAVCQRDGRKVCFYETQIRGKDGTLFAKVMNDGYRMDRRLPVIPPEERDETYDPYREQKA